MPLEGNQLTIKHALALCYAQGFRGGKHLITAVCVMSGESQRYVRAYNVNSDGSTDRGLFQINNRWHPKLADPEVAFDPRRNVAYACSISSGGRYWRAWHVYTSGRYLFFWPRIAAVWVAGKWRDLIPKWEGS